MKPAHLVPCSVVLACLASGGAALGQAAPADAEPAAAAPAPPPAPMPPADLPPPPPPRGSPPPPPQGKMIISDSSLPPPTQRAGYHVHDGFYLRLGAGVGGGHFNISSDSSASSSYSVGGPGLALNLWIGGTPWRGVAIGGMGTLQGIGESDTVVKGQETSEDMSAGYLYLGPFVDVFPDPLRGLHLGGSLGLASFAARAQGNVLKNAHRVDDFAGGGFGGSAWVGYMGFVGPEWSLGGMLQLTALGISDKTDSGIKRQGSGYSLSLSFTALCH